MLIHETICQRLQLDDKEISLVGACSHVGYFNVPNFKTQLAVSNHLYDWTLVSCACSVVVDTDERIKLFKKLDNLKRVLSFLLPFNSPIFSYVFLLPTYRRTIHFISTIKRIKLISLFAYNIFITSVCFNMN